MARSRVDVTDAELAILEILWTQNEVTIRQIARELYGAETKTSAYSTVQKLLERLERKGCVKRDRSAFAHTFSAGISRSDLIDRRLQEVADKLAGGSWTPLLLHLVDGVSLSARDRERLRNLIEKAQSETSQGGDST